jgi:hypothetical protein
MTDAEWLACQEPQLMLLALRASGRASDRKLRLFMVACCRCVWDLMRIEQWREAVEMAEQYAEGAGSLKRMRHCRRKNRMSQPRGTSFVTLAHAVWYALEPDAIEGARRIVPIIPQIACAVVPQADLLRDLFGPLPFRPVTLPPSVLAWNDGCVVKLAAGIYQDRDFSSERMGVLADALEEAGLTDEVVLEHLRGPGPHVRGCWAVDLLTCRE